MNKKFILILTAILLDIILVSYSISLANTDTNSNKIVINEIAAYESNGEEWIEILNISDQAVDLSGWKFWEDETKHGLSAYQGGLILESNQYAIIADEAESFATMHPDFTGLIIDSSWTSLKESGEGLGLIDEADNFVELFTYAAAANFSLERANPYLRDFSSNNWQEHSNSNSAGHQNSNYSATNSNNQEAPNSDLELVAPVENLDISFDGQFINLNWEYASEDLKTLILKSTINISASPETGIEYQQGEFLENAEIIKITANSQFQDGDYEDESNYYYSIFSFDSNFNYSESNPQLITIPYLTELNDILINEFVSNPKEGEEEWIELYNNSKRDLDLNDFYLQDSSSTKHILDGILKANNYLVIENLSFTLNNSDDQLTLFNQYEQIIYSITYGTADLKAPSKGQSAGLLNDKWILFGNPTKASPNKIINNTPQAIIKVQSGSTTGEGKVTINLDGSESYDLDGDSLIYEWDFGDGSSSDKANPASKTYNQVGSYIIKLQVTDSFGTSHHDELKITVKEVKNKSSSNPSSTKSQSSNDTKQTESKDNEESDVILSGSEESQDYKDKLTLITQHLKISEFLPNPNGTDDGQEWIEIYNNYTEELDLKNILIDDMDGGSKPFSLNEKKIAPKSYLVIYNSESKISLNQSNDSVRLIMADGTTIEEIKYEKTEEGQSYALIEDKWQWNESPSPGKENLSQVISIVVEQAQKTTESTSNLSTTSYSLKLSEIYPNPFGRDTNQEWVEIYNPASQEVNLKGWSIDDSEGGSKAFVFEKDLLLSAQSYLAIYSYDSKINLNNTADEVRLFSPAQLLADRITYEGAREGQTLAMIDKQWLWTDLPTPNQLNILFEETEDEEEDNKKYQNGQLSENIQISELLPNPEGKEADGEWIELYNDGPEDIKLGNWYLMDESKSEKRFVLSDELIIKANSYILIPRSESKIALDNSGDSVYLYDFEEELQSQVSFEKSIEGESFAMIDIIDDMKKISIWIPSAIASSEGQSIWSWTKSLSPGKDNPVYHKIQGQVTQKLDDYLYLQNQVGQELQINIQNLDINNELSETLLSNGTEIEILALQIDQTIFDLQDFEIIQTAQAAENPKTISERSSWQIIIPALMAALILAFWKLKEKGLLRELLVKLAERCE